MADSMKFGPEWLRNMSQDGNPSGGPAPPITSSGPKYQLADYRYGREEMLALYDEQAVISSPTTLALANLDPVLYSEVVQTPVSFIPMTEEETRIYNRGFNSRGFSNPSLGSDPSSGGGKPFSKMNTSPLLGATPQATNNSFRSRNQAGIERGRGRGVPGSSYHTRPGIKDGSDLYNNTMNRNRFGVNSDLQSNRGWGDRNGILDPDSKKEGQGLHNRQHNASGGSVSDSNWRRFREDDEPWRPNFNRTNSTGNNTEKWGGRGSWRQQAEQNARSSERDDDKWEKERGGSKWDDSKNQNQYSSNSNNTNSNSNNGVNRLRRYSFNEDNLPEWATENLSETRGGTFDSNGAYHGVYSDDENDNPRKSKDPGMNENRYYASQSGDNTPNPCYEDSISPPGPYGTDSPSKQHFENISPTRHLDGTSSPMKPPAMKPNEVGGYKDSPQADKGEMHHQKTSSPSHKNSAMEPNNRLDSNELMNQRLSKVVDDIDRLITEEDSKEPPQHMESPTSNGIDANIKDKWLYKDPQGSVQGPFTSAEMAEWYRSGYFRSNLLVRRLCDEQFSPLGDLFHFYGNIPFLADNSFPAIKASDHIASQTTNPRDEALLIQQFRDVQYKRAVLSQQQQLVNTVVKNLQQHDNWNNLSILEQQSLISQHMNRILHTTNIGAILFNQPTPAPINIPPNNPIMQLVAEMTRQDTHFPTPHAPNVGSHMPMSGAAPPQHRPTQDPIPTPSPHHESPHLNHSPHPEPNKPHVQMDHSQPAGPPHIPIDHSQSQQNNSVHMFLRQVLAAQQSMPNPPSMSQMLGQQPPHSPHQSLQGSHVWGAPGEKDFMRLDSNNYYPQPPMGGPEPPNVHNQTQLDQFLRMVMGKDMENKDPSLIRPQEEKKPEAAPVSGPERSKPDEVKQTGEEKKRKKQQEEKEQMEAEARKQREKEEALQKQQEEEKQKRKEEEKRRKAEEQKKKKEEKEKEKLKKQEEEKRKKAEEEMRMYEELKKKEKEEKRKLEQQRQEEALRKLEEQQQREKSSNKTWTTSTAQAISQPTLADIQKIEKEQKQQQLKQQQQQTKKQQKAQQQQGGENQKSKKSDKKNEANMKLGWNSAKPVPVKIQSLAEIQAEQTEQLAKQLEKEKQERLANPRAQIELARSKTQIWGGSSSVPTNYAQASAKAVPSKINHVKQPQSSAIISNPSSGFWDEPVKILTNPATASKNSKSISNSKSTNSLGSSSALSSSNSKAKKEEIKIKEIFTTSALKETSSSEFYNWCKNSLASMKINELDVPTFIGFLKDVESPKEVKDYVKLYIGEGKQAMNFANQYLEKRQACNDNINNFTNSAIKANNREQSKSKSISNVLNASKKTEFVEVKGKNKKNKKGKMRAVDTTLLGFSVTADPDRFNVGERELPDV
ncbi:hypothetical protein M8J77_008089 [Diaphorina citri]|nr:hypothetical protein M8J77_008089 [Diaphorina citri]